MFKLMPFYLKDSKNGSVYSFILILVETQVSIILNLQKGLRGSQSPSHDSTSPD